nr:endothelin-converting enzyme 1-like [Rhipicephalus microplus]
MAAVVKPGSTPRRKSSQEQHHATATSSGVEGGRGIHLPPAVIAAAAALHTPSSRQSSQGSIFSTIVQHPSVAIFNIVVAVLCMIVCLAMLVSFLLSLLDDSGTSKPDTCTTHACREYSSRLMASLNWSVDPCHSFTRFVCDGWRQRQVLGVQEEAFGAAIEKIARIVHTIDVPPVGQNRLQRAVMVYWTCTALLTTSPCELDAVKSALRAAGVMWPHRPPPAGRRDLLRMMFHCDYALGWSAVFRVDPESHRNATTTYVLTDSGFNFVVRKYHERSTEAHREHYFNHLRDAFRDADGTADVVTLKEMHQLEDMMFGPLLGDLYKSEPKVSTVPDDVVYNSSANLSMQRWTEVMRSEGVDLKGTVEFRTRNLPFFSTFVNLLVRHGELDMYAYASWCTVQVAALFTNAELILNYYGNSRRAAILHGAFCLSRAYIAGGRVLLGNYAREVLPAVARPQAETIALNVEAAFLKRLSAWADYDSDVSVMRSWNSTTLSFSMFAPDPEDNVTDIIVGEMSDSFLQNWRNAWRSRITHRGLDVKIAITAIETLSFSADIGYRKDFILLPYVFSFPYYDVNAMSSINYGGFGAKVAFAVGQRFHGTYLSEGAGGASFSAFLSCISNASLAARLKDAPTLFAEVVSLGAVVDTYRNSNDRQRLVHMESLTGDQLLFVAMCYARCVGIHYAVHDSACDAVLQNVPEFSEAFSCARGSPMNPHQQCKLL